MGRTIVWTDKARRLLIEAVIQVENERIVHEGDGPSQPSACNKWDRINSLLPPELQGRSWNSKAKVYNRYRCRRSFDALFAAYRGKHQRKRRVVLSGPLQELMKKYEDLTNGRPSIVKPKRVRKSRFSKTKITGRDRSRNDLKQPTPTRCRSLNSHASQGHSTDCRSRGVEISQGGSAFLSRHTSERSKESVSFEEAANVDNSGRGVEKKDSGDSIRQRASRSLSVPEGLDNQNRTEWTSMSESKNLEDMSKAAAARPGVHIRAQNRNRRRRDSNSPPNTLSSHLPALSSTMNGTTSMTRIEHEDYNLRHASLDRPRKRIDLEFSRLSSWLEGQSIPVRKQVAKEVIEITCSKRRKSKTGTAIEPFDDLINESHRKQIDLQIRFSFQQLRTRLAVELKIQSLELPREVFHDLNFLSNFPS